MARALEVVARLIADGKARQIVVMAGAGISTASGIPDFRSPRTGLYANLKKYKLPYPEAIFDINFFKRRPSAFYALAKELYPTGKYRPNIAHYFFRLLYQKRILRRVYTQNIDGLERVAGVPPSKLVEAHGTFATARCLQCGRPVPARVVKTAIDHGKVARCFRCKGLVKPDVVFFDEALPQKFWRYREDIPKSDLIFVMGTSLETQPFSKLVAASRPNTPRILLNKHPVGPFKQRHKPNDLVALGDISCLIRELCTLLGWTDDLENLMLEAELKRIDYIGLGTTELITKSGHSQDELKNCDTPRHLEIFAQPSPYSPLVSKAGFDKELNVDRCVVYSGLATAPASPELPNDRCRKAAKFFVGYLDVTHANMTRLRHCRFSSVPPYRSDDEEDLKSRGYTPNMHKADAGLLSDALSEMRLTVDSR
ncbi:unnamed protein product [Mesocestoides corti]|uniref:Deacetylase sirtuin-type domain-containing protein n=1 Tax=Mesocestoides corti TaxID=53468 RepID=A0A0R3UGL0_MESCO|nr:unnamed protein product [Mesocestoides corti]